MKEDSIFPVKVRYAGWDVLRIFLALTVFAFHSHIHIHLKYGVLNEFVSVGAISMTGFFILSGTVLYHTHGDEKTSHHNIWSFYKKRFLGIMPLYWVVAILFYLDNSITNIDVILLPVESLGLQAEFTGSFDIGHNGGTWFVSCLLICYFFFL